MQHLCDSSWSWFYWVFVNYISIECLWVLAVRKGKQNKYELKCLKIYYNFIFENYLCMDLPTLQRKKKKKKKENIYFSAWVHCMQKENSSQNWRNCLISFNLDFFFLSSSVTTTSLNRHILLLDKYNTNVKDHICIFAEQERGGENNKKHLLHRLKQLDFFLDSRAFLRVEEMKKQYIIYVHKCVCFKVE